MNYRNLQYEKSRWTVPTIWIFMFFGISKLPSRALVCKEGQLVDHESKGLALVIVIFTLTWPIQPRYWLKLSTRTVQGTSHNASVNKTTKNQVGIRTQACNDHSRRSVNSARTLSWPARSRSKPAIRLPIMYVISNDLFQKHVKLLQ